MHSADALNHTHYTFEIDQMDTAEAGLLAVKAQAYDLILLDYPLLIASGMELINELNASEMGRVVVMLSHADKDETAMKCLEQGAQDFIIKSEITPSRLMSIAMQARQCKKIEGELLESRSQLQRLAERDTLTNLSNRYMFEIGLEQGLALSKRHNTGMALLVLDLDNFKNINDTMGHGVGDTLLQTVAKRLTKTVRGGDMLCRLGGDEFAILMHDLEEPELIDYLTKRIFETMREPLIVDGVEVHLTVSIGVATYPGCGEGANQLLKCADIAMYQSKDSGRNQVVFYSSDVHERIMKRVELERDLHSAVSNKEFYLCYQPQVNCETEEMIGIEALIRWKHPEKGLVSPEDFIPMAEKISLINDIGDWVFETAFAQYSKWRSQKIAFSDNFSLSVNVSALQLEQSDLAERVEKWLKEYDLPASSIEIEVTETSLINGSAGCATVLCKLAALGVKLSLDDFGTGYSSLAQLQELPFSVLKVDKSFVKSIDQDNETNDTALFLEGINALAKILKIETVVEGVETETQIQICQRLDFDRLQGYYYAQPMSAEALEHSSLLQQLDAKK